MTLRQRIPQMVLIVSIILGSWLGMQAVHEFGHVLGAWLSGGKVERVVLYPLTISRTDLAENPAPLFVVWAGPVVGASLPVLLWLVVQMVRMPGAYVLRFFAGFCLSANGLYIGIGSFDGIGDCGEMLRHGSPQWSLWLFGFATAPFGLWLWHQQGEYFGLGTAHGAVDRRVAYGAFVGFVALLTLACVIGGE